MPLIPIAIELAKLFAPSLVRMIAGDDAAAVAQVVVDTAQKVTGAHTPEEAKAMLEADAQKAHEFHMEALKQDLIVKQMEFEERKDERVGELANIQGARVRDTDIRKVTGGQNTRADWMVAMAAIGLVGSMVSMCFMAYYKGEHPEAISEGVFAALLTQLANTAAYFGLSLRDAFTFEFGSSRGSRIKDETAATVAAVSQRK